MRGYEAGVWNADLQCFSCFYKCKMPTSFVKNFFGLIQARLELNSQTKTLQIKCVTLKSDMFLRDYFLEETSSLPMFLIVVFVSWLTGSSSTWCSTDVKMLDTKTSWLWWWRTNSSKTVSLKYQYYQLLIYKLQMPCLTRYYSGIIMKEVINCDYWFQRLVITSYI